MAAVTIKPPSFLSQYHNDIVCKVPTLPLKLFVGVVTFWIYALLGVGYLAGCLKDRVSLCFSDGSCEKTADLCEALLGTAKNKPLSGRELHAKIEELRAQNQDGWQDEAIELIHQSRNKDPDAELLRLRAVGILNPATEPALTKKAKYNKHALIVLAQALEMQSVYKDTHYVFFHGQPSNCTYLPRLLKALEKAKNPDADLSRFEMLRPFAGSAKGFTDYSENSGQLMLGLDATKEGSQDLLSVNASFDITPYESATHFLVENKPSRRKIDTSTLAAMKEAYPKASDAQLMSCLEKIKSANPQNAPCGNLFLVCVPKDQPQPVFYRSEPYGLPFKGDGTQDPVLKAQSERVLLGGDRVIAAPQYRIYMPGLRPEKGHQVHCLSAEAPSDLDRAIQKALSELPKS